MKYLLSLIGIVFCSWCNAQKDSIVPFEKAYKRIYHITKSTQPKPVLDGKLDDDFWKKQGEWSDRFVQIIPYERVVPNSPTWVKLIYDDKYIYVGVYCKDIKPEKMNRFISNRDDNSQGDLISVAFDTYHDYRVAPEFNINLGGNKTDLTVTDKLNINRSWNAVWEGRTHVNLQDSCWTAELRIPFSQLRYNQKSDGIWGLHVRRIIRRNNEVQNWSMIPLKNNGHVFSFGEMHGMTDLPKPKGIEFLPYVMGKYRREPRIAGSPFQKGNDFDGNIGLDAKFALSDFTLDVTVNPDYGQVELDPSVMNLTAYETFYDEKRPFFLEGKHIFDFANSNDMMFYSRRIGAAPSYTPPRIDNIDNFAETTENVPIIGALKLTGTNRKGVTVGALQSVTAQSSTQVSRNGIRGKDVVEPLTNYSLVRIQKNWDGNTLLGGMITSVNRSLNRPYLKDFMVHNAFSGGIDFIQYFKKRLYYIDAKGMFSSLHGSEKAITLLQQNAVHYYQRQSSSGYLGVNPNRRSLSGTGGYVKLGRKGNARWNFAETFSWSSPGFDLNDMGYIKETDNMSNESEIAYRQTDIWKIFRYNAITLTQKNQWNYGGRSINNDIALRWLSMTMNRFELDFKETFGWNRLNSRLLRGGPDMRFDPYLLTYAKFNTDKAQPVMLMVEYNGDHTLNRENKFNTISPSMTFRLGNHVFLSGQFDYAWNTDDLQYVTTAQPESSESPAYVMGFMEQKTYAMTLKLHVNVTPDIAIQFYGSPFTSTAKFSDFKEAAQTTSFDYDKRFHTFTQDEISKADDIYHVTRKNRQYSFKNPNFNFNEFRSNLVARWEYLPGSTLYFVWEHRMSNRDAGLYYRWGDNLDRMFNLPSTNTFMIKLNYWFCL
ncbi:MAG: carbohydrate binding family 9 domain-containing protein [Bacteroidaceae bacterium]|nr:carbohydrate binding family 9 domain-containing protein [Bacteroidaceae bacterium]